MGYRSNIHIKITNDIAPEFYKTLQEADMLDDFDLSEDDNYTYATMYDVKWYDSYEDVATINNFIAIQENGKATMIREGEEMDDIEVYGSDNSELDLYFWKTLNFDGFADSPTTESGTPRLRLSHPEYFI